MKDNNIQNLQDRTDAKIRYAEVHLAQLKTPGLTPGSDCDRANQESFLFHLLGAKEAFLNELNAYYKTNLTPNNMSLGNLRDALKEQGKHSSELSEVYKLENENDSWLFHAKKMRDHSTHVSNVNRAFHIGGANHGQVFLRNPNSELLIERHFVEEFNDWTTEMRNLLNRLRSSAIMEQQKINDPAFNVDLNIRKASTDDARDISALAKKTFTEAFGQNFSPKALENYLHQTFNPEKIKNSIAKDSNYYFVAIIDVRPVAYVKLKLHSNYENLSFPKQTQLQKIYVLKKYIGHNIGTLLLNESVAYLQQQAFDVVWLDVLQTNSAAIRFYQRHGFEKFGIYKHKFEEFESTFDVMVKKL